MIIRKADTLATSSAQLLDDAIEEILALLHSVPHVDVYESLSDEEELEIHQGNTFTPYVVISFSGTSQVPRRYRAMTGARNSGEEVSIVVRVVASNRKISRAVRTEIHNKLLGFTPKGCSEIRPALYFSTGANAVEGSPHRFSEIQSYEMSVS